LAEQAEAKQHCCGSGSGLGRIRIGLPDRINSKHMYYYFFHENFNMLSKILKIMTHLPLMSKEKHCKLALLKKSKMESQFRVTIGIKTMPIQNTAKTKKTGRQTKNRKIS
jgi:hypothetical protein